MSTDPESKKHNSDKDHKGLSTRQLFLTGRFSLIWCICLLLAAAIVYKLICTVTVDREDWNNMAAQSLATRSVIVPERGNIYASDGSILATNLSMYTAYIDFRTENFRIVQFDSLLPDLSAGLARMFPKRDSAGWNSYLRTGISKPRSDRSRYYVIARGIPYNMKDSIRSLPFFSRYRKSAYSGLGFVPDTVRAYPFGRMAALSVGRVNRVDSIPGFTGYCGLEYALDSLLYGKTGVKIKTIGSSGTYMAVDTPAVNGCHITTTIDITIQDILESELGDMLLEANADWGSAIIMEVGTGDIKAISNLERDTLSRTPRYIEARNRIVDRFEPGSVMKVMTMAVAMRYGYVHLDQTYPIGHSYPYLSRKPITDTHSPGSLKVRQFLCYSSNIGMTKLTMPQYEDSCNLFRERLREMGFFDRFNTGISGEKPPKFPSLPNNVGGKLTLSRMCFGYSTAISPLYTCAFYNAVANDGQFVRPRLVRAIHYPDGRDSIIPVTYVRDRILTSAQAAELRSMIRSVVWEQGGTARSLQSPVVEIAAKTGTAYIAREVPKDSTGRPIRVPGWKGGYIEGAKRLAICGFFPYDNPRYTCMVLISRPRDGRHMGAASSSGQVLKGLALKMYARGMLDENPAYQPGERSSAPPVFNASFDHDRNSTLARALGFNRFNNLVTPVDTAVGGRVPNVMGVDLREALYRLESAGYVVTFEGSGRIVSSEPSAGTPSPPGTTVHLTLDNNYL